MIAYGYPALSLESELDLAASLRAQLLEILPDWQALPDPFFLKQLVADRGLAIHSAHGCWGSRVIKANRVDLGHTDPTVFRESVDDLRRCLDWLHATGGRFLVVHPGGLSARSEQPARTEALARGLTLLADHARNGGLLVCVENMPPGVSPGSQMEDLHALLRLLGRRELALALDTGHAHLSADLTAETLAAGGLLATTHVHDNNGRSDSHDPPGRGTIDWPAWSRALDHVGYSGPIMLECVRQLRADPSLFDSEVLGPLVAGDS
jgi:sugar phosphate isomerase/epimerase